jgi:hypothetical protein
MFSPYEPGVPKRRAALLKYLNQPALAVVMLVTFALLSSVGGKESPKSPSSSSETGGTLARGKDRTPCPGATPSVSLESSRILSVNLLLTQVVERLRKAFNDPALIDYANQQGIGIPGSSTTPLPGGTSKQMITAARISDR